MTKTCPITLFRMFCKFSVGLFGGVLLLSVLYPTQSIKAQESVGNSTITAIPPRVDLTANPGQTVTTELKIRNETSQLQYFTVFVNDFIVNDNYGTPIPVSENITTRWTMSKWIQAPDILPVDKGATQVVKVTIRVPQNALPGGHYAMITYQPSADRQAGELKQTGSILGQRVGSLILLNVNGAITQNALIKEFSTAKFHEYGPVDFNVAVENQSDIHVTPKGTVVIRDIFGRQVGELKVDFPNIFPEATRSLTVQWLKKWGYGRYRADLNLAYGTAGGVVSSTIFFWLFPIRLVVYLLLFIVSTLIAIIIYQRRHKDHEKELETEVAELKQELIEKYKDRH